MIIDVRLIDTTPGTTPGPCSPAFIPPETVTTRKQYAAWLLAQYETSELVAQHVYMARRWNEHEWSRPLQVTGPYADAFPRILTWVMDEGAKRRVVRQAALVETRLRGMPSQDGAGDDDYHVEDEAA